MIGYDFYVGEYLGEAMSEQEFIPMEKRAEQELGRIERIYTVQSGTQTARAMAICAMAEVLFADEKRRSGVTSATVGKVSVHYGGTDKSLRRKLTEQASVYLDICRGVRA